ncbi:hypothetical protein NNC19_15430 [Clostridium sp. SHJSY1]|uniref:hypothetical protein n=1 Tax=Clostridium sp. SHJSY1 TaxID=2942483 RepID=UPI00287486EC|nr:hypothetical protein [Clostridium sp. SHJSY1]MDS0527083.1 hypothetical protein [Clostridium sp. SHJSY1]
MNIKKCIAGLCVLGGMLFSMSPTTAHADSPITSTNFYQAYSDVQIVEKAREKGVLDEEIANYLHSSENPIDVKAAVINALGWRYEGKHNAEDYLKLFYSDSMNNLDLDSIDSDELFCIGYMMALDDYFNVERALPFMEKAYEKNNTSFTVSMIRNIVKEQSEMSSGHWGNVWANTKKVLDDKTLTRDMKQGAIDIIVDYMKLYEKIPAEMAS